MIDGLNVAQTHLSGVILLAAEIDWRGTKAEVVRPEIDWKKIRSSGKPCSIALRVAPFSGQNREADARIQFILEATRSLLEEAHAADVPITEFELDFDCGQEDLANYAKWIRLVQSIVHPTRFVITALPVWLNQSAFSHLVREADGYVLQVHSVPTKNGESMVLCDPRLARGWVERAARLHVPFSVALPTYRCSAGYDPDGKLLSVAMDSVQPAWPPGTHILEFSADADEMATLVKQWKQSRPVELRELIWYRVPVATDIRNWQWKTLSAVMSGQKPLHRLEVSHEGENPCDIAIANTGEADEPLDTVVTANWEGAAFVAADALPGWSVEVEKNRAVFRRMPGHRPILPPGASRKIGWIRYSQFTTVQLELARKVETDR